MADWQPIETAPRDGTEFLGHCADGFLLAHWSACCDCFRDTCDGAPFGARHPRISEEPWAELTHWQPLPTPPAGA